MFVEKRYATVVISRYAKLENMREREREGERLQVPDGSFLRFLYMGGRPVVIGSLEKGQVHVLGRF